MKTPIKIASRSEVAKYYACESLNQSTLKRLLGGLAHFKEEKERPESKAFLIGGAVDCMLLHQEGEFERTYYVGGDHKMSELEKAMVTKIHEVAVAEYGLTNLTAMGEYPTEIHMVMDSFEWQMKWKPETRLNKIIEVGRLYFHELTLSVGKKIITFEEMSKIQAVVDSIRNSPKVNHLISEEEDVETYFQLPIYFNEKAKVSMNYQCKALVDIVKVKRIGDKVEVTGIDLKTMGEPCVNFINNAKAYRYDIQAAFYRKALSEYFEVPEDDVKFDFLVESVNYPGDPKIFHAAETFLTVGKYGCTKRKKLFIESVGLCEDDKVLYSYEYVKGYKELLNEHEYYDSNGWEHQHYNFSDEHLMW